MTDELFVTSMISLSAVAYRRCNKQKHFIYKSLLNKDIQSCKYIFVAI